MELVPHIPGLQETRKVAPTTTRNNNQPPTGHQAQPQRRGTWITLTILLRYSRFKDQYYSIKIVWNTYAAWVYDILTTRRNISGVKLVASARRYQKIAFHTSQKHLHHDASQCIISHK